MKAETGGSTWLAGGTHRWQTEIGQTWALLDCDWWRQHEVGGAGRDRWQCGIGWQAILVCGDWLWPGWEGLPGVAHALSCAQSQPSPPCSPPGATSVPSAPKMWEHNQGSRGGGGAARPPGPSQEGVQCRNTRAALHSGVGLSITSAHGDLSSCRFGGHPTLPSPHPLGALCIPHTPNPRRPYYPRLTGFGGLQDRSCSVVGGSEATASPKSPQL